MTQSNLNANCFARKSISRQRRILSPAPCNQKLTGEMMKKTKARSEKVRCSKKHTPAHETATTRVKKQPTLIRDAGERGHGGGISHLPFEKGATGAEVLFHNSTIIAWFIKIDL